MADNQIPVPDLNRIIDEFMSEHHQGVEEVHLEPSSEIVMNAEPETQPAVEEPIEEERAAKRQRVVERTEEGESEEDGDFVFAEAKDLWKKSFCAHTTLGFSALAKEYYANMVGMREDTVYVRGVWVPFGDKRINEMF